MIRPSILILAAAFALSACAKVGTLEQPAPLYGDKAKAKYEAQKRAAAQARAKKEEDEPDKIIPDKTYDPNADPSPARSLPIPGAHETPNQPGPQGVLPDPMNPPPP